MDNAKIRKMAVGGQLLGEIRRQLAAAVKPGVTGLDIEKLANELIAKTGGQPAFKKVPGYDYTTCISVNEGIVHGLPNNKPFKATDLVGIDLGLYYQGYFTDTATTVVAGGRPSPLQQKLLDTAHLALASGISQARVGNHVSAISKAIQKVIEDAGFVVIRDLTGHGVGKRLHEDPLILNYYDPRTPDPILKAGQTIAIEPMFSVSSSQIRIASDGWTITTADKSLSIQVEHTLAITPRGPQILT